MTLQRSLAALLLAGSLAACTVHGRAQMMVTTAPPAPRVVEVQPRPGLVWVQGRWEFVDGKWTWREGTWTRERAGHVWVQGRWVDLGGRWQWHPGHWARPKEIDHRS